MFEDYVLITLYSELIISAGCLTMGKINEASA